MRHDARTCGTLLGQLNEREVLRVEQAGIERHLSDSSCNSSDGKTYVTLHLSASHLGIYHIIIHRVEAQQIGGHRTVQGERTAIASSTTQGIAVGHLIGSLQEQHIIGQTLGISTKPQAKA